MTEDAKILDGNAPALRAVRAAWVADGTGRCIAPGVILLRGRTVVAVGSPASVGDPGPGTEWTDASDCGVLPALVNAHAHLDLTLAEAVPHPEDFHRWLAGVRGRRMEMDAAAVERSVQAGAQRLLAGGVAAVGDIAGLHAPEASYAACSAAGIAGCVYEEVFGMGPRIPVAMGLVEAAPGRAGQGGGLRRGLQPHAPYSSDRRVYEAALRSGLPVSTHLAELLDEHRFLGAGEGPFRALLESLGLWDGGFEPAGQHPVRWLADRLRAAPGTRILCAHLNYVDDDALAAAAAAPIDVAYCPRASSYFGHREHRYREMRAAGINVCLGTDSALCLDTPDRISTLDDLRFLMRRDGLSLADALAMATVAGARALGADPSRFAFGGGPVAGVLAVPLGGHRAPAQFGETSAAPQWILGPMP